MLDSNPEMSRHLDPERQEAVLRQALQVVPSVDVALAVKQLLSHGGCLVVLLGQFLRARDSARERIAKSNLADETNRLRAIKDQGQMAGIDLCIDLVFDLANFEENTDATE